MKFNYPVLGIDVGGQNIKAGWVKERTVKDFRRVPFKAENIKEELLKLIASFDITKDVIIGVGFPGFVQNGIIYTPPNLPTINELNLEELLKKETGSHVYVFNDANAVILGEALYGAAKNYRIVVGFTLGTGIGGGFIIDKEVYTGSRGFACEIGHTIIDHSGPICECGKRGCLEAFIGAYALTNRYKTLTDDDVTVKEIFKRAIRGEVYSKRVVDEFGFYLGIGINNVVEIFDPDIIVLAGGVSKSGDQIIEAIEDNNPYDSRCMEGVRIVIAKLGDKAGPVGAANWALKKHKLRNGREFLGTY